MITLTSILSSVVFFGWLVVPTRNALASGMTYSQLSPLQKRLLSGLLSSEFKSQGLHAANTAASRNALAASSNGCPQNLGDNIRVNSNCLNPADLNQQGHAQAQLEPTIAEDPLHPGHLIAGNNDYRTGDSICYGRTYW